MKPKNWNTIESFIAIPDGLEFLSFAQAGFKLFFTAQHRETKEVRYFEIIKDEAKGANRSYYFNELDKEK